MFGLIPFSSPSVSSSRLIDPGGGDIDRAVMDDRFYCHDEHDEAAECFVSVDKQTLEHIDPFVGENEISE